MVSPWFTHGAMPILLQALCAHSRLARGAASGRCPKGPDVNVTPWSMRACGAPVERTHVRADPLCLWNVLRVQPGMLGIPLML